MLKKSSCLSVLFAMLASGVCWSAPAVLDLWPGTPPGDSGFTTTQPEKDTTKPSDNMVAGKSVIRLGNVSKPTITIYPAPSSAKPAPAVIVCPGGGYHILAMDLEGTEVCEWLNSIGVTGVLLKYRVPTREGDDKHAAPLRDAQRAISIIRHRSKDLGIDPAKIGILGFSAGGHLAASASVNHKDPAYPPVYETDDAPIRPDFTILVYPAYLTMQAEGDKISPTLPLSKETPPTFLVMAQDDPVRVENVLNYAAALKKAGVPMELHVYPSGGHGYGLRKTALPITTWPDRVADWLRASKVIDK